MPGSAPIDFPLAIERNRVALLRIVVSLFGMLGLMEGAFEERISRHLRNAVFRILRPAESAVRRLIFAAAQGLEAKPQSERSVRKERAASTGDKRKTAGKRDPAFKLSDQHEPFLTPVHKIQRKGPDPSVSVLGEEKPTWLDLMMRQQAEFQARQAQPEPRPEPELPPPDDGCVEASRLMRRLMAIKKALEDIPKQAKRMVQWQATRQRQYDDGRLIHTTPLRRGDPPGKPRKPTHEVHKLLEECDWLAWEARKVDTS